MTRHPKNSVSKEEFLEILKQRLHEENQENPSSFTARKAEFSRKLITVKKSMGILIHDELHRYIGDMMENAFYLKTEEHRDENSAMKAFEQILNIDAQIAEANYRYGFLLHKKRNWTKAIHHFNRAVNSKDVDFPLTDDQIIKAHLFIGYCSVELAKESMEQADHLFKDSQKLSYEGISIDELSMKLKNKLMNLEYNLTTHEGTRSISMSEYEAFESSIDMSALLLNFVEGEPFIQKGNKNRKISRHNAILLKKLLLKSIKGERLSLMDISGYQEEIVANSHDISWDSYRQ